MIASPRTLSPRKARRSYESARPVPPRGVREDLPVERLRQLVEKVDEELSGLRWRSSVGDDEVGRLTDGEDPRGLLVGDRHPVGVLELQHEL